MRMTLRRFLTRRVLIAVVVVAVLSGTGAFVLARNTSATVRYRTVAATLGTVTQTVSLSGNLTAVDSSNLSFSSSGRVTAVDVQVGQQVAAGATLATIDPSSLQASLATAQANLAAAQARLATDENPVTSQSLASAQGQVSSASVALQNAQTAYNDTVASNNEMMAQAQAQQNSDCGANPSGAQCAQDKQTMQADAVKAQQSDDQAQAQVNTANVQLQNAQASLYALTHSESPTQVQVDQAAVQSDQVQVSQAQQALDGATLTAPSAGVVAEVNITAGEDVGSSGSGSSSASSSSSSSADVVVITPGMFAVTGSVSDAEVDEIALNQSAQVVPAGSQEAVTGKVTSIAEEATVTSGVATFPVTVTLDGSNPSLRAGMSATVSVIVNQVVQVLTVPTSAVHTTAAGSTVQLLVNGQPQTVSVQVGAADATRTQILSGLNPGDQVIIATISSSVPTSSGSGSSLFGGGGRGGFTGGGGSFTGTGRGG
ncbi:MAG: biotin/lipoyl-binding protein [Candidatus Dormibacteraeota bacterium]|nr:biotin/lipoyl-binding protein [Candidatus Dormibacteraeota bacterium]